MVLYLCSALVISGTSWLPSKVKTCIVFFPGVRILMVVQLYMIYCKLGLESNIDLLLGDMNRLFRLKSHVAVKKK